MALWLLQGSVVWLLRQWRRRRWRLQLRKAQKRLEGRSTVIHVLDIAHFVVSKLFG